MKRGTSKPSLWLAEVSRDAQVAVYNTVCRLHRTKIRAKWPLELASLTN